MNPVLDVIRFFLEHPVAFVIAVIAAVFLSPFASDVLRYLFDFTPEYKVASAVKDRHMSENLQFRYILSGIENSIVRDILSTKPGDVFYIPKGWDLLRNTHGYELRSPRGTRFVTAHERFNARGRAALMGFYVPPGTYSPPELTDFLHPTSMPDDYLEEVPGLAEKLRDWHRKSRCKWCGRLLSDEDLAANECLNGCGAAL